MLLIRETDTGRIIKQGIVCITEADDFISYPYLQAAVGAELEIEVIDEYNDNGSFEYVRSSLDSKLWTHPTIGEYLYFRINGVK